MKNIFKILGWITAILSTVTGCMVALLPCLVLLFVDVKMAKNTLFLILAKVLGGSLAFLGFVYAIIKRIKSKKAINEYLFSCAVSKDQNANVFAGDLLDDVCSVDGRGFGDPDLTVSESIGFLLIGEKLTKTGNFLNRLLNLFEENHTLKSIGQDG